MTPKIKVYFSIRRLSLSARVRFAAVAILRGEFRLAWMYLRRGLATRGFVSGGEW